MLDQRTRNYHEDQSEELEEKEVVSRSKGLGSGKRYLGHKLETH